MSSFRLDWRGDQVRRRVHMAEKNGVDRTMADAVRHAKSNHAWKNRTGTLEGSIAIADYARQEVGGGFRGVWGSRDVRYALIHELGGTIRAKRAPALVFQVDGQWVRTQQVTIPKRPYLRPAADATYGDLDKNIRLELDKLPGGSP